MALPIAFLAQAAGAFAGNVAASATSGLTSGFARAGHQTGNRLVPNELPDANSLMTAWQRGFFGTHDPEHLLRLQGVAWTPQERCVDRKVGFCDAWKTVEQLLLWRPDPASIYTALAHSIIGPTEFHHLAKRAGIDVGDMDLVRDLYTTYPALGVLFEARNRGLLPDDGTMRGYMRRLGYSDVDTQWIQTLRLQIPSPADLVRFQVREAFDPTLAGQLGYWDEAPQPILPWMEAQGYGWGPGFQIVSDGVQRDALWTDLWWAGHWQTISPGQAYEMYHRLRPERIARFQALGFDVQPFGINDVRRHLRVADYPKSIRDYLAAMSSSVLDMRIVRQAIKLHEEGVVVNPDIHDWAVAQFRDRGLLPDDAETQYQVTRGMVTRERFAGIRKFNNEAATKLIGEILQSYEAGLLNHGDAVGALQQIGVEQLAIDTHLDAIDTKVSRGIATEAVNATQRDYMAGILDRQAALQELAQIGIMPQRANQYLTAWSLRRDRGHRAVAAGQIVGSAGQGLISLPQAATALENLGYRGFDEGIQLLSAARKLSDLQERQQAALDRKRQQGIRELERIRKEAEALQRRVEADLRRVTPIGTLKSWYKSEKVDRSFVTDRLSHSGFDDANINRYLDQWDAEVKAAAEKAAGG